MTDSIEIELYLEEYVGKIYKRFRQYSNFEKEKAFRKHLKEKHPSEKDINPYELYTLKILDLLDEEFKINPFFDQHCGLVKQKSKHSEGNYFMSSNEIHSIMNELSIQLQNKIITEHIVSRIRVLSLFNTWCPLIDCDAYLDDIHHSKKYYEEVKQYLFKHKNYMKYSRLLKCAIYNAKLHEHPDVLPRTESEFMSFLITPFIYVMLEPYNYILKEKDLEELDILLHNIQESIQGLIMDNVVEEFLEELKE
jgi:hypothetical protein